MTTQSFHINGFWHHVSLIHSNVYRDQHNNIWILKNNRFVSECGSYQSGPVKTENKGWLSADDLFLQSRESYHEYFNTRYYKSI
jgi:hypothetical protein